MLKPQILGGKAGTFRLTWLLTKTDFQSTKHSWTSGEEWNRMEIFWEKKSGNLKKKQENNFPLFIHSYLVPFSLMLVWFKEKFQHIVTVHSANWGEVFSYFPSFPMHHISLWEVIFMCAWDCFVHSSIPEWNKIVYKKRNLYCMPYFIGVRVPCVKQEGKQFLPCVQMSSNPVER